MQLGTGLLQYETAGDPQALAEFAQAAEQLGYSYVATADNVLDADLTHRRAWDGPTVLPPYFDPFVVFGYLAALTRRLELFSGVLVLPQRQTALVAKQAAEVDLLSNGRLRLGVGVGWSEPLFQALNEDFRTRGARIDEQVAVLRALWIQESVTFHGRWHDIEAMRIRPLPRQRPIPIWFGGHAEATLRRVAASGDGWMPLLAPDEEARQYIERLHTYARAEGRAPHSIGIMAPVILVGTTPDDWRREVEAWKALGATHLTAVTRPLPDTDSLQSGTERVATVQIRIDQIRRFKEVAEEALRL